MRLFVLIMLLALAGCVNKDVAPVKADQEVPVESPDPNFEYALSAPCQSGNAIQLNSMEWLGADGAGLLGFQWLDGGAVAIAWGVDEHVLGFAAVDESNRFFAVTNFPASNSAKALWLASSCAGDEPGTWSFARLSSDHRSRGFQAAEVMEGEPSRPWPGEMVSVGLVQAGTTIRHDSPLGTIVNHSAGSIERIDRESLEGDFFLVQANAVDDPSTVAFDLQAIPMAGTVDWNIDLQGRQQTFNESGSYTRFDLAVDDSTWQGVHEETGQRPGSSETIAGTWGQVRILVTATYRNVDPVGNANPDARATFAFSWGAVSFDPEDLVQR